ncbi:citrate synthase [Candidatus Manganitrophus noduliformans]|uniref:Citrate synthase n=1 Tax=Candidatus Manganitrophus noduliformans TaxID=2606439 RepID=A0A7X6IC32_9BACT|nr:citrate synthase [Candidatus Manganitrophus noduliformans]NKE72141.1 citrate synthase [Candidatus Manganitrophus noduliformans]
MSDYSPGLAGVPATRSKVSYLDGTKGVLEYRGIRLETLADRSNFIETAYLLLFGNLPTPTQLEKFDKDLRVHRRIKYRITDLIKCLPDNGHPMDALQAAVAALGMFYPDKNVQDEQTQYLSAVRLIAKIPTIVAAYARLRRGDDQIQPRDDLNYTENFLYMLTEKVPDKVMSEILDTCLILHAEHTMNASTFSGLVTASTLADPYTVVSSAVGTLKGPLHGGANEKVLTMLKEIGSIDRVRPYIEAKVKAKQRIMGLGHREYKVKDPRAIILQRLAKRLFEHYGKSPLYEVAVEVEKVGEEYLASKKVYANVDFYSGILYQKMGIETDFFTPIFAMARVVGWLAHWIEQVKDNHIFRPTEIYEGEHDRAYVPLSERKG